MSVDLRHRIRDRLPDPSPYPAVPSLGVPCPEHGSGVQVPCPCVVLDSDGRLIMVRTEAPRLRALMIEQQRVLSQLTGVTVTSAPWPWSPTTLVVQRSGPGHRQDTDPALSVTWFSSDAQSDWVVSVVLPPGLCDTEERPWAGRRGSVLMPYPAMVRALMVWAAARPSPREGLTALTGYLARLRTGTRHNTLAQELWATSTVPMRPDGRFEVAGFTEPYPGAWPGDAVDRAYGWEDLTALWPYLDGPPLDGPTIGGAR